MWNYCCLNDYSEQIVELDRALKRLLQKLKMQEARDVKEVLVLARQNRDKLDEVNRRLLDIQKLLQERAGDVTESSVSGGNAKTLREQSQGNGEQQGEFLGTRFIIAIVFSFLRCQLFIFHFLEYMYTEVLL